MRGTDTYVFSYVISKSESIESLIIKIFAVTNISNYSNSNIVFLSFFRYLKQSVGHNQATGGFSRWVKGC